MSVTNKYHKVLYTSQASEIPPPQTPKTPQYKANALMDGVIISMELP